VSRSEAEILNGILHTYGREPDVTLYRNNTGQHAVEIATRAHLERILSFVLLRDALGRSCGMTQAADLIRSLLAEKQRFTRYGLCKGSSDIIGIVRQEVYSDTPPYGERFHGIFLAIEVKAERGRVSVEQQQFIDLVNRRGGVAGVARSEADAGALIERARIL